MAKRITYEEQQAIVAVLRMKPRIRFERVAEYFGRSYTTVAAIAREHDMVQRGRV